jgi:hypothetical protein
MLLHRVLGAQDAQCSIGVLRGGKAWVRICLYLCVYVCICVCVCSCLYLCAFVCVHICVFVCICLYLCVCACLCVFVYALYFSRISNTSKTWPAMSNNKYCSVSQDFLKNQDTHTQQAGAAAGAATGAAAVGGKHFSCIDGFAFWGESAITLSVTLSGGALFAS